MVVKPVTVLRTFDPRFDNTPLRPDFLSMISRAGPKTGHDMRLRIVARGRLMGFFECTTMQLIP